MKHHFALLIFTQILAIQVGFSQVNSGGATRGNLPANMLENIDESIDRTTLKKALKAADLERLISGEAPFTLFAPSNKAFLKLSTKFLPELLRPENKEKLYSLITHHIVPGQLTASKILRAMCRGAGRASFTTLQGNELVATMDGIDIVLTDATGNEARIITADGNHFNGIIHFIDNVISPNNAFNLTELSTKILLVSKL